MSHVRWILAILMLLLPCSLWSRDSNGVADGSDWKEFSEAKKIGWIDGWVTAMSDAQMSIAFMCALQLHLAPDSEELKACTAEARKFNFEKIQYGQFLEGMDAFYKDFRNTEYPLEGAIRIVRDQINGRPAEDIEKELAQWRQCRADVSKCFTPASPKQIPQALPTPKMK